jgi:uncharacterized protein involved in exopolysaccharide biosynthesis
MEEDLNILDYLKVISKWRKFIISFTGAAVILTVLICTVMPWTYRAETTLLIPSQTNKGIEGLLAISSVMAGPAMNVPSDMSQSLLGQSLLGRTTNFSDILKSRTIAGMLVDGLSLQEYYRTRDREKLISMVQKKVKVKEQKGILKIYAEDKSPRLAADLANYSVIALDNFNKKGNIQFAKRLKNFVRDQLAASKVDLEDAEENLKKFETQSQMVKISEKELMLLRLMREVKVKEAIYTMLMQEYEKSKLDETKEELFFEVMDPAYPPKRPYTPKPFLYSVIALVLGGFCATTLAFFFEHLERLGINVPQINYEREIKWANLKRR